LSAADSLESIANSVREAFGELIQSEQLRVSGNELWIEIELSSSLLFTSGDAVPNNAAFDIIEKVAKILAPFENPIHVEGFTDNQPIQTAQFPTNWELSTARAASIVRMLAMDGVNPSRMAAVGYGEFQPVADNATAEGRGRNRRVVLVISRNLDVRRSVSGIGSAKAQPDEALQRAGTQPALPPAASVPQAGSVNPPSPVQ
jgi:chemotaxis protein MotB